MFLNTTPAHWNLWRPWDAWRWPISTAGAKLGSLHGSVHRVSSTTSVSQRTASYSASCPSAAVASAISICASRPSSGPWYGGPSSHHSIKTVHYFRVAISLDVFSPFFYVLSLRKRSPASRPKAASILRLSIARTMHHITPIVMPHDIFKQSSITFYHKLIITQQKSVPNISSKTAKMVHNTWQISRTVIQCKHNTNCAPEEESKGE